MASYVYIMPCHTATRYLESSSADEVTRDMSTAVSQGLKAEVKASLKRAADEAEDARGLLRMDLRGGEVRNGIGGKISPRRLRVARCAPWERTGGSQLPSLWQRSQGDSKSGAKKFLVLYRNFSVAFSRKASHCSVPRSH